MPNSPSHHGEESGDAAAARIINFVMFAVLLAATAVFCAWDLWRQVAQLAHGQAAPTSAQWWRLAGPAVVLLSTMALGFRLFESWRRRR